MRGALTRSTQPGSLQERKPISARQVLRARQVRQSRAIIEPEAPLGRALWPGFLSARSRPGELRGALPLQRRHWRGWGVRVPGRAEIGGGRAPHARSCVPRRLTAEELRLCRFVSVGAHQPERHGRLWAPCCSSRSRICFLRSCSSGPLYRSAARVQAVAPLMARVFGEAPALR